ncbi:MAG: protease-like activity factor CPAF, partial [Elusimicrobiota bacterium]
MRRSRGALAILVCTLIASPMPGLMAARVVARTTVPGLRLPTAPLSTLYRPTVNPGLTATQGLPTTTIRLQTAPLVKAAPGTLPAMPTALPALPASALAPVPAAPTSPAATAENVSRLGYEVEVLLESAGPIKDAASEDAAKLGDQVFDKLTGEQSSPVAPTPAAPSAPAAPTLTQQKMVQTLYQVASIFAEQYAPLDWKKDKFQLDLKNEYESAKAAILTDPDINTKKFQDVVARFTANMRDYHVSISFNSTEGAKLPFTVVGAKGKYYIAYINRQLLPEAKFPFREGDEVRTFDGRPTAEVVAELGKAGFTPETEQRLGEMFLTNRRRSRSDTVPQGKIRIAIKSMRDRKVYQVGMSWLYTPELVPQDVPLRNPGMLDPQLSGPVRPESDIEDATPASRPETVTLKDMLKRAWSNAMHPLTSLFADMVAAAPENPFMLGARKSFVPQLGETLWQSTEDDAFHAYIFKTKDNRKVGFIRINTYMADEPEAMRFGELMAKFQLETDALVIDQVNNPGGSVFYLYALASHLTDKPLKAPHHRLIVHEDQAQWAADLLLKMMRAKTDPTALKQSVMAKNDAGETASGYPVTQKFMKLMVEFAKFILSQFESGKRFTDPTHLWGVDDIDPYPKAAERYTKPILLLTNALDFSGGDFFPSIMQDNKRATILGVRTSGAGGAVKEFGLPNQFGIA